MNQNIEKEIIQMLSDMTGFEPEEIQPGMQIVKDLGIDSIKVIEIATANEQKYKVVVKESQMTKIRTVGEAIEIVEELVEKKQRKG